MLATGYTLSTTTKLGFTETAARVREELKAEGFGILCEIDVLAARTLTRAGHDVRNLRGGMNAWARAGLPLSNARDR